MLNQGESKVFCIGLPRTGTTSIHLAFQYLGLKSIHYPKELWGDIHHPIMASHSAFSDTPLPLLYQGIDKAYPKSLFVLTTRELNKWLKSCQWMYAHKYHAWGFYTHPARTFNLELFGTTDFDEKAFSQKYHKYHDEVLSYFGDRHDLLLLDLEKEANPWQKLCTFLGTDCPSVPFPHHRDYRSGIVSKVNKWIENSKYKVRKMKP